MGASSPFEGLLVSVQHHLSRARLFFALSTQALLSSLSLGTAHVSVVSLRDNIVLTLNSQLSCCAFSALVSFARVAKSRLLAMLFVLSNMYLHVCAMVVGVLSCLA